MDIDPIGSRTEIEAEPGNELHAEFVLDEEDLVAFFTHHGRQSKVQRQRRLIFGFVAPGILLLYVGLRLWFSRDTEAALLDTAPLIFIAYFLLVAVTFQTSKKRLMETKKMLREGLNRNLASRRRLEIRPSGVTESWQFGSQSLDWRAIERVARTESHLFLYVSAISAHIVPRRAFQNEAEFEHFCATAQRYQRVQVRGRCGGCGYDLLGTKGERCPECGRAIPSAVPTAA